MRRTSSILVLFVLLGFGLSLGVPAEDVPETAYDESEALPYESTPLFSIAVSETVAKVPAVRSRASQLRCDSLRRLGAQHLEHGTSWAYRICDSLTILAHALRC